MANPSWEKVAQESELPFFPLEEASKEAIAASLKKACLGAHLLVSSPLLPIAPLVAKASGIPWVPSVLSPLQLALATANAPAFSPLLEARQKAIAAWEAFASDKKKGSLAHAWEETPLILAFFSEVFAPREAFWPKQVSTVGFLFPGDEKRLAYPLPEAFLAEGPPPVVVSGSSWAWMEEKDFFSAAEIAIAALGLRGIFLIGKKAFLPSLPNCLGLAYAPHHLLLPRASAIIHHGGIGTLAAALRAGIPQVVVPQGLDQPDNAKCLQSLGAGEIAGADAESIAEKLAMVLDDIKIQNKINEISKVIEKQNAILETMEAIEEFIYF